MRVHVRKRYSLASIIGASLVVTFACPARSSDVNEAREYGAYLSSECVTCHRTGAGGEIPTLVGRKRDEIVTALGAFKSGARQSAVMQQIASQLAADEMAALAEYFSSLTLECRADAVSGQDKQC